MSIQFQLYGHFIIYKISIDYISEKIVWKFEFESLIVWKFFCICLRESGAIATSFKKNKMSALTENELKLHQDLKICYISKNKFILKFAKDASYCKVRNILQVKIEVQHIVFVIQDLTYLTKFPVALHNGSNYYYNFIIKELGNQFKRQFNSLGKNREKWKTFFFTIRKRNQKSW